MEPKKCDKHDIALDWKAIIMQRVHMRNKLQDRWFREIYGAYSECIDENRRLVAAAAAAFAAANASLPTSIPLSDTVNCLTTRRAGNEKLNQSDDATPADLTMCFKQKTQASEALLFLKGCLQDRQKVLDEKVLEANTLRQLISEREDEIHEKERQLDEMTTQFEMIRKENSMLKLKLEESQQEIIEKSVENQNLLREVLKCKETEATRLNELMDVYSSMEKKFNRDLTDTQSSSIPPVSSDWVEQPKLSAIMYTSGSNSQKFDSPPMQIKSSFTLHQGPVYGAQSIYLNNEATTTKELPCNWPVATIGFDGYLALVNSRMCRVMYSFPVSESKRSLLCLDTNSSQLALVATNESHLKIVNVETQKIESTLIGHASRITCCAFDNQKPQSFSTSEDSTIRIWDLNKSKCAGLKKCESKPLCGAASQDGNYFVTGHMNGNLNIWSIRSGDLVRLKSMSIHTDAITGCQFSQDSKKLVTQSKDRSIKILESYSWKVTHSLPAASQTSTAHTHCRPLFSPDGQLVCAAFSSHLLCWNLSRAHEYDQRVSSSEIHCICWSHEGLFTGHKDGTVAIWQHTP